MRLVKCKLCGSTNVTANGEYFLCENCGCRYVPQNKYERQILENEQNPRDETRSPSLEDLMKEDDAPNPVRIEEGPFGYDIIDLYTQKIYTVEQYRKYLKGIEKKKKEVEEEKIRAATNKKIAHMQSIAWIISILVVVVVALAYINR